MKTSMVYTLVRFRLFTLQSKVEVERIELSSESRQRQNLHTYLLHFCFARRNRGSNKHPGGLTQIGLRPLTPE